MTTEFNLSDKIKGYEDEMEGWVETEDVRKFIRLLKEEFYKRDGDDWFKLKEIINELAGDKLTKSRLGKD